MKKSNNTSPVVYIIAGEPSGDFIGSKLIHSLKKINPNIKIIGVGGLLMEKEGLKSLFDIKNISVMGIFEILPKLFKILKLIKATIKDIDKFQPDLLITIDSPGFNLKIANIIKKKFNKRIKLVHYVAPSVWAYKPKRAKKFAKIFDYLFCLLPFEPPYFNKEGLKAYFVGHPIVESKLVDFIKDKSIICNQSKTIPDKVIQNKQNILLLPGSRVKEVTTLLPIFLKTAYVIKNRYTSLNIVIITIPQIENLVKIICENFKNMNIEIISDINVKYKKFLCSEIAIAASGTVTLELALAKIKTVVAYKLNLFTTLILYLIIKVKFVSLINIMANKAIFPELLGLKCTSKNLINTIFKIINKKIDIKQIDNILYSLGYNNFCPSEKAANLLINIIKDEI